MRMENAVGMRFACPIVAKHEIELVLAATQSRDRRDRIMRNAPAIGCVAVCINVCSRIGVFPPCVKDTISRSQYRIAILANDTNNR
ncbi:hypothetical protein D3C84_1220310 [compost metagenome]